MTSPSTQLRGFILNCFDQSYRSLLRAAEGLTAQELAWRPDPQCNSIGFLLWHWGRVLDLWTSTRVLGQPQLWEQGWAGRLGLPADPRHVGFAFTVERLEAFVVPPLEPLLGYVKAVYDLTVGHLASLNDNDLATRTIENPYGGQLPLETLFQQLIWELNQHGGQVAYLRGMLRGLEDRRYTGGVIG